MSPPRLGYKETVASILSAWGKPAAMSPPPHQKDMQAAYGKAPVVKNRSLQPTANELLRLANNHGSELRGEFFPWGVAV